jgi:hypothetical protein
MRLTFPIGIKFKTYYEKINVTAYLQSNIDKEIKEFYNIPLNEESFDSKIKEKNIMKKSIKSIKKIKKGSQSKTKKV